jgi:hypothetical protein
MKFNSYVWKLYKESEKGRSVIDSFDAQQKLDIGNHLKLYNPKLYSIHEKIIEVSEAIYHDNFPEFDQPTNIKEARELYKDVICHGMSENGECIVDGEDYEIILLINHAISYALYVYSPEYFFPNLFMYNVLYLNKISDYFEIDLPPFPPKSDYKARCMYYMDLCETFYKFRTDNNLSPMELCAFLYDFSINFMPGQTSEIPEPSQVWFIGGSPTRDRKNGYEIGFWQANPETKKGDILVMYETYPVSAIASIWRAHTDGVIDPFFHYYSNCYIADEIKIPHISLKELKSDPYFSNLPLVKKQFQGVNGVPMSSMDYSKLQNLIKTKKAGINLPQLYAPIQNNHVPLVNERDVEKRLLEPLLLEIGLSANDYVRQLPIRAGRGSRIYPDYALFFDNTPGYEKAKVLIEAKYSMRNNKEIEDSFKQARSYANILESELIIICDKSCILIYENNGGFNRNNYVKYYWEQIENPDIFNGIKKKINMKRPAN